MLIKQVESPGEGLEADDVGDWASTKAGPEMGSIQEEESTKQCPDRNETPIFTGEFRMKGMKPMSKFGHATQGLFE